MFSVNQKGKARLVLDGHMYDIHRKNKASVYWVCFLRKAEKCCGSVTTKSETDATVVRSTMHDHAPNAVGTEVHLANQAIRERAPDHRGPALQLYNEVSVCMYQMYVLITFLICCSFIFICIHIK